MITRDLLARLCRARDQLRDTSEYDLPVARIAAEAGLSRYHFIRQFAALFGETPHRFRRRHRLELAKRLLAEGGRTVTDVCMSVGFSSPGSFSTLFGSRFGESPRAFQRRIRASTEDAIGELTPGCISLLNRAWQLDRNSREATTAGARDNPRGSTARNAACESS